MEWISVSDRLPDNYTYVLVCSCKTTHNPVSIARWEIHCWNMLFDQTELDAAACGDLSWWMDAADITHWMPLPSTEGIVWNNEK